MAVGSHHDWSRLVFFFFIKSPSVKFYLIFPSSLEINAESLPQTKPRVIPEPPCPFCTLFFTHKSDLPSSSLTASYFATSALGFTHLLRLPLTFEFPRPSQRRSYRPSSVTRFSTSCPFFPPSRPNHVAYFPIDDVTMIPTLKVRRIQTFPPLRPLRPHFPPFVISQSLPSTLRFLYLPSHVLATLRRHPSFSKGPHGVNLRLVPLSSYLSCSNNVSIALLPPLLWGGVHCSQNPRFFLFCLIAHDLKTRS